MSCGAAPNAVPALPCNPVQGSRQRKAAQRPTLGLLIALIAGEL